MTHDHIRVRGASQNNLRALDVDLPRDALVVFTGLSGSGKSSLAYETIYRLAERRTLQSFSTFARQFNRPRVPPRRPRASRACRRRSPWASTAAPRASARPSAR